MMASQHAQRDNDRLPHYAIRPGVTIPDWTAATSPAAHEALVAIVEAFDIEKAFEALSPGEDSVRSALLRLYAERGRAPSIEAIAGRAGVSEPTVRPILASLQARDLVVLDADGDAILGAYPFTDCDTDHKVMLGDRTINAMCAIDALGAGEMYGRDVEISSRCRNCGAAITIATSDQGKTLARVEPTTAVVWSGIRQTHGCAANTLCTVIAFFCDDAHLEAWRAQNHSESPGYRLSIDEGLQVGRAIFAPSLANLDGRFS